MASQSEILEALLFPAEAYPESLLMSFLSLQSLCPGAFQDNTRTSKRAKPSQART